jgi:hypothetical protein
MDRLLRWITAWTVTAVVCVTVTWVAGAVVLPVLMSSADSRWVTASGLGLAAAGLAALWGHGFATREESANSPAKSVMASGSSSIAVGGDISGSATTGGRGVSGRRSRAAARDCADSDAERGQVTASGPNSIAIGRDLLGTASTGGDVESPGA